ncbi:hypothetical protein AB0N09_32795 [Streptomyces erythrochromogenes]|uniref:hypothetical protein n=1 Tax=Streptomyces erythrochromogenes TaxID=285574 RepID=UPI0034423C20
MERSTDWLDRLFPEEAQMLDWSSCTPVPSEKPDPDSLTLAGSLQFFGVKTPVQAELDLVREDDAWGVVAVRLPEDHLWEDSTWNSPERDFRVSADAKERLPRISLLARLNLYLLEHPFLYDQDYVSPLHQDGRVDFEAVGTGKLSDALEDALRQVT